MANNTYVMFLKFFRKKEYADSFLNGYWYFNTVKFFIELEKKTGIRGVGDKNELTYQIPYCKLRVIDPISKIEIFKSTNKAKASLCNEKDLNTPLLCFVKIVEDDLIHLSENKYSLPFSKQEIKKMNETFGPYCVLMTVPAVEDKIIKLKKKFRLSFNDIKYVEPQDESKAYSYFNSTIERFFYKDIDLSYQREFRLCIFEDLPSNHIFRVDKFEPNEALLLETKTLQSVVLIKDNC